MLTRKCVFFSVVLGLQSFHSYISLIVGMVLMPGVSLYACNLSNDSVLALQLSLYTTRFIFRKLGKCVLNGN